MIDNHRPIARGPLTREEVARRVLGMMADVEARREWGFIRLTYQAGVFRIIERQQTMDLAKVGPEAK